MPGRGRVLLGLGLLASLLVGSLRADWDFSLIVGRAEALYGPLGDGRQRIDDWQRLLASNAEQSEEDKLRAVNRFFNHELRFVDDSTLWGKDDYWATPVEALLRGAGDCEDFAIAKYISLRRLGVANEKLQITYVKALRLNQAHMVLTYYAQPKAVPLVLDNLVEAIQPASQRTDLLPVYAFNGEGLWLPGAAGNKRVGDSKRLSRWQDLLSKMRAEGFPEEPAR
ncbi:cysteine protease LapG [Pseudomonas alcaligenes]|uniref:cysteine protease LapG n=1 Tax=Pseudomonas sp. RIT-PI-AD TaxID=3035294 RepID=UPI0021DA4827